MVSPTSVNLLLCERVLVELDSVTSAIRIVDVFFVNTDDAGIPLQGVRALFTIVFLVKFPNDDNSVHHVYFDLISPDGQREKILDTEPTTSRTKPGLEQAARGMSLVVRLGFKAKMLGSHYIVAILDDTEVARTPFTLAKAVPDTADSDTQPAG